MNSYKSIIYIMFAILLFFILFISFYIATYLLVSFFDAIRNNLSRLSYDLSIKIIGSFTLIITIIFFTINNLNKISNEELVTVFIFLYCFLCLLSLIYAFKKLYKIFNKKNNRHKQ